MVEGMADTDGLGVRLPTGVGNSAETAVFVDHIEP